MRIRLISICLLLFVAGRLLASQVGPDWMPGQASETYSIGLDLEVLNPDGSPFGGPLRVVFAQNDTANRAELGPFLVYCNSGKVQTTLDLGLDYAGISLDSPVLVQLSRASNFAGDMAPTVWLDPDEGALAESEVFPREIVSGGVVSMALDGLVLAPAPLIGAVSVPGSGSAATVSIVPGDFSTFSAADLDAMSLPTFELLPGSEYNVYGWAKDRQWTLYAPGGVAEVHARGSRVQFTPVPAGSLCVEWPNFAFPDKTRAVLHEISGYSPLPEGPPGVEYNHSYDVLLRFYSAKNRAFSRPSGSSRIAEMVDLQPGTYVLELWGGALDEVGQPVYQATVQVNEGEMTSLMIQP